MPMSGPLTRFIHEDTQTHNFVLDDHVRAGTEMETDPLGT